MKSIETLAASYYPFEQNENNDEAIRQWNYKMYDKRDAFIKGFLSCKKESFTDLKTLLFMFWNRSSDACPLEASEMDKQLNEWERWISDTIK